MGTEWTIQTEASEDDEWTVDDLSGLDSKEEKDAWKEQHSALGVSSFATPEAGVLGWANTDAENFAQLPEDVDIAPEDIQADNDEWTIVEN